MPYGYQQQTIVGYVPVYYASQYYNSYQPFYTSYSEPDMFGNAQQFFSGGQSYGSGSYPSLQNSFPFFKRYFYFCAAVEVFTLGTHKYSQVAETTESQNTKHFENIFWLNCSHHQQMSDDDISYVR